MGQGGHSSLLLRVYFPQESRNALRELPVQTGAFSDRSAASRIHFREPSQGCIIYLLFYAAPQRVGWGERERERESEFCSNLQKMCIPLPNCQVGFLLLILQGFCEN